MHDNLKQEKIVGSADMTPAGIEAEAKAAGLKNVSLPTCSVAGVTVASGADARCFASYMRIHALEASGGLTYSQMPRYASKDGKGTNDVATAMKSSGQPLDNPVRAVWVSETAFSTALNVSYMADQLALFGVVVGIALLLSGIGFIVLAAFGVLRLAATVVKRGRAYGAPSGARLRLAAHVTRRRSAIRASVRSDRPGRCRARARSARARRGSRA